MKCCIFNACIMLILIEELYWFCGNPLHLSLQIFALLLFYLRSKATFKGVCCRGLVNWTICVAYRWISYSSINECAIFWFAGWNFRASFIKDPAICSLPFHSIKLLMGIARINVCYSGQIRVVWSSIYVNQKPVIRP